MAAASDVIFTIVGYPADVREVVLGRRCAGRLPARQHSRGYDHERAGLGGEIAQAAAARGVQSVDAPVSGGDVGPARPG